MKYFLYKDQDPIYVWKNKTFTDYANYCHKNKLNCMILPHQQTYADLVWMNSIQYVWSVVDSTKTRYLYWLLDNITNLSLYWTYPYVFWELLIPINKNMAKNFDQEIKTKSWLESTLIWEKWKLYNCDQDKLKQILQYSWSDFYKVLNEKLQVRDWLKNPCVIHEIPWYLWFNYFYYLSNGDESGKNYQIASFNEDTPKVVSSMVAVVAWRMWQHTKSMGLWFSQYISLYDKLLSSETQEEKDLYSSKSTEAQKKSFFEFELSIIERAANGYWKDKCVKDYSCLNKNWYIYKVLGDVAKNCSSFKPKDFEWDNLYTISDKSSDFYDKLECFMIMYWYKSWYITKYWELIYPFEDEWQKFEYIWDDDISDWWVKLKN